jgi:transposase
VVPELTDQPANRKRRVPRVGGHRSRDPRPYKRLNVVQRSFNLLMLWRPLATRYGKYAVTYGAGAVLAAISTWLRS